MTVNDYNSLTLFEKVMIEEMGKIRRAIEALKED
jgi:hypothetical protein